MPSCINSVTFDCRDALVAARFWAEAPSSNIDEDATAGNAYVEAPGWGGPNMWFNQVPELNVAKNRLHLDLRARGELVDEVRRLRELGAVVVSSEQELVVMQDPDGNEFYGVPT